MEFLIIMA